MTLLMNFLIALEKKLPVDSAVEWLPLLSLLLSCCWKWYGYPVSSDRTKENCYYLLLTIKILFSLCFQFIFITQLIPFILPKYNNLLHM